MAMKIKKIAAYALVGGFGIVLSGGLSGCSSNNEMQNQIKQGAFVILEEIAPNEYKILEEYPSEQTRVIVKDLNGNERILTDAEINELLQKENSKIDNGTSKLTGQNASMNSGGLSLGEAILSSAAGAIIGSWIGNKLFGSPAYQSQRQAAYKTPSAYSKSINSFNEAKKRSTTKKSGFFGGGSKSNSGS